LIYFMFKSFGMPLAIPNHRREFTILGVLD
jgi:hypothetical protein